MPPPSPAPRPRAPTPARPNAVAPDRDHDERGRDARAKPPVAEETLPGHAIRLVRTKVAAVLDTGIAGLQHLREKAAPPSLKNSEDWLGTLRSVKLDVPPRGRAGGSSPMLEAATAEPAKTHRLRSFIIYSVTALALGIGATLGAISLIQELIGPQLAEIHRLEAKLKKSSAAEAAARAALEAEQAKRVTAEKRLARAWEPAPEPAAPAASAGAEAVPASGSRRRSRQLAAEDASASSARPSRAKSGDCAFDPKNIGALKGCIADFNNQ